jgi:anti-sigma regulatory factor (Ser/Thr protein kinase)
MPYVGETNFVGATVPFIQSGLAAGEPMLVVTSAAKVDRVRAALGSDAPNVEFAQMSDIGHNPATIIPAWRDFVDRFAGRPVRGIGEPIYQERTGAELVECLHHEALLNLAFSDRPNFSLMCPIDVDVVSPESVDAARSRHPWLGVNEISRPVVCAENHGYESKSITTTFDDPLPDPNGPVEEICFDFASVGQVRAIVQRIAADRGVGPNRCFDFMTAVNEAVANSLIHGGGLGTLRVWSDDDRLICEVSDRGRIEDPLVGRRRPSQSSAGQRGVWMMNQLCDLVQIRSGTNGTVVRLHSLFSSDRASV